MSKMINELGNTYTYLTVIDGPIRGGNRVKWKCKCKCGNEVVVAGVELRNGHTKSCGCYQKEQTASACIKDLTGQTIGNFTPLEYIPGTKTIRAKWRCRCNLCGNENVIISNNNMKQQESCGCLSESKGSRKIKQLLINNNINFIQEKRFSDLVFSDTGYAARFDFFLPELNCLIEYDGRQHYFTGNGTYDNLEKFNKTKAHDSIKNEYANNKGITLIRIPYTEYDNITIEDLLPLSSKFIIQ